MKMSENRKFDLGSHGWDDTKWPDDAKPFFTPKKSLVYVVTSLIDEVLAVTDVQFMVWLRCTSRCESLSCKDITLVILLANPRAFTQGRSSWKEVGHKDSIENLVNFLNKTPQLGSNWAPWTLHQPQDSTVKASLFTSIMTERTRHGKKYVWLSHEFIWVNS